MVQLLMVYENKFYFPFILGANLGYKIIKVPNFILYKKINKTQLDNIRFSLEDSNHNPVDFNAETITLQFKSLRDFFPNK